MSEAQAITLERCLHAHEAAASIVRRTPVLTSAGISERCGGTIALKAECLQRTGSFKLRGALEKLRVLDPDSRGVVAGSAGNHAQSLAYAARERKIPCEVFMPLGASVSKSTAVEAFGAVIHREGESVDECLELARERAAQARMTFVHPFDDEDIITGQAGVGIELAEQARDLSKVIVPVGGGGLISGVAIALKHQLPDVQVIGVQASACDPFVQSLKAGLPVAAQSARTIADGIAVKQPGQKTLALISRWVDDVVSVDEDAIAAAMVLALERSKLVVEGAGAASLAALLTGVVKPAEHGSTVAILSGGNVDIGLLAAVAARQETRAGRRVRLHTHVSDRPGGLAALLAVIAESHANVIALEHIRDGVPLSINQTLVALTIETRGKAHLEQVLGSLSQAGYDPTRAD